MKKLKFRQFSNDAAGYFNFSSIYEVINENGNAIATFSNDIDSGDLAGDNANIFIQIHQLAQDVMQKFSCSEAYAIEHIKAKSLDTNSSLGTWSNSKPMIIEQFETTFKRNPKTANGWDEWIPAIKYIYRHCGLNLTASRHILENWEKLWQVVAASLYNSRHNLGEWK